MTEPDTDVEDLGEDEDELDDPFAEGPMADGLPNLNLGYSAYEGRILLGRNLVLTWGYAGSAPDSPRCLTFEAEDAAGERLVTLAVVPVEENEAQVPQGIYRDVWRGSCAMARRLFPSLL